MKESEKLVDPQLWHACAGSMVQIPPLNSLVFYFRQGHAEHCLAAVDFSASPQIPPLILCRVAAVKFCADSGTDEVHAKLTLVPLPNREVDIEEGALLSNGSDSGAEKPSSFAKTLTQSDANNGGGFSVPRYCAETIFPRLDYTADPPVQMVVAKDVHGEINACPIFSVCTRGITYGGQDRGLLMCYTDTDLAIAKEFMEAKGIKQLPVVQRGGGNAKGRKRRIVSILHYDSIWNCLRKTIEYLDVLQLTGRCVITTCRRRCWGWFRQGKYVLCLFSLFFPIFFCNTYLLLSRAFF